MKLLSMTVASLISFAVSAQSFYDLNTIQEIKITFAQSNWDALLDAQKAGAEDYTMAQTVEINGTVFDSVGVKYKGNSTYRSTQTKNPFHIELDTYKDQEYQGYSDIKLSNVANDPSFVREVLSYQILRQYVDAPLCNYANVYVNGDLIGLYSNAEAISKKFVKSRFGSKNNTFVKCNPPAGAGPGTTDYPNLTYLGTDSTKYYASYEIKSDAGWGELIDLIDTLNTTTSALPEILDINRALWMIAFNNVLVNLDSYSGGFAQNYYLYRSDYNHFLPIVWDLNESFGKFTQTGSASVRLRSTTDKQQLTHLLHQNDADYPLIQKLLSDPTYKRMYVAHCKTMLQENFDDGSYLVTGDSLQSTIDAAVLADNNKFFTYANFTSNLRSDISGGGGGPGGGGVNGIGNLMDGRSTYLLGLSDFTATAPSISTPTSSTSTPTINGKFFVTSTISNEDLVLFAYRFEARAPFVKDTMFDDGNHGDGAANDGVYGIELIMSGITMDYYIYAENNNAGLFSPRRVEKEFYNLSLSGALVINEVMSSNTNTVESDVNDLTDWIELYNAGDEAISLGDYYLSDDNKINNKWKLPELTLAPKDYAMVWASGEELRSDWNANFKISKSGESIGLYYNTQGIIGQVDYVEVPALESNTSYGRETDGADEWIIFQRSTPDTANHIVDTTSIGEYELNAIQMYPNPMNEYLIIELGAITSSVQLDIYDAVGRKTLSKELTASEQSIPVVDFQRGVYVLVLTSESGAKRIEKLVKE